MLIKFNNAASDHAYEPLYIDSDWIVALYEEIIGDIRRTVIYGGPTGTTWVVQETLEESRKIINRAKDGGNVA